MNKLLSLLFVFFSLTCIAQTTPMYVAAKGGLSIRQTPDAAAKVLDKIPFGTKVNIQTNEADKISIRTEGLLGFWSKVTYNNKTGYILDSYLLPVPPPKAGIKDMKQYFAQISSIFGNKLVTRSNTNHEPNSDEPGWELQKQFYKNGAEWHQFLGYEYGSNTYFLPEFTMQQAFLLLRMMPEFAEVLGPKDEFPLESVKLKKGEKEFDIKVQKEVFSTEPWVHHISIEFEDGAIYSFKLYQVDNQIVVFYGAGV